MFMSDIVSVPVRAAVKAMARLLLRDAPSFYARGDRDGKQDRIGEL
jgi:hypothetical protein